MRSLFTLGLLVLLLGADDSKPARERYDALIREYAAAEEAWELEYGSETRPVERFRDWPAWSFLPRFLAIGEANPRDPAGADSLIWVVDRACGVGANDAALQPYYARALLLLSRPNLIDDERVVASVLSGAKYASPASERYLRVVLGTATNPKTRGLACLALADQLKTRAMLAHRPWFDRPATPFLESIKARHDLGVIEYIRKGNPVELTREARDTYLRAMQEFGGLDFVVDPRRRAVIKFKVFQVAARNLKELDEPQVGLPAPEIEGTDAGGKVFRLSDYRGKVVVLTFSTNAGAPSRALYPHQREMVAGLKQQPFVLLSVNADADRGTLDAAIKEGEITWRCWWDGPDGPIVKAWAVDGFPRVFVLDADGMIRHIGPEDKALDRAVEALLNAPR